METPYVLCVAYGRWMTHYVYSKWRISVKVNYASAEYSGTAPRDLGSQAGPWAESGPDGVGSRPRPDHWPIVSTFQHFLCSFLVFSQRRAGQQCAALLGNFTVTLQSHAVMDGSRKGRSQLLLLPYFPHFQSSLTVWRVYFRGLPILRSKRWVAMETLYVWKKQGKP